MGAAHGRLTKVTLATKDISPYTKTSTLEESADVHDTSGYGITDRTKIGGVGDGKFTMGGTYDNTVSVGPRNVLHNQKGVSFAVVRNPEGTGTGKPNDAFTAILVKYTETNPFDDIVTWAAEFEISGSIVTTVLP
jgi:hypothetical protein